jgi:hypothetical protein
MFKRSLNEGGNRRRGRGIEHHVNGRRSETLGDAVAEIVVHVLVEGPVLFA